MKKELKTNIAKNNSSGFTLIEVVLVMVVTAIVFIAVYGLYANTVKQDLETRYEIMASNLAQEGVEIIRNSRDRAQLRDHPIDHYLTVPGNCRPFFNGQTASCDGTRLQEIEFSGGKFDNCVGACGAGETPFRRQCNVACDETDGGTGDCIRMTVACNVSWNSFVNPALVRSVEAISSLTSWQE